MKSAARCAGLAAVTIARLSAVSTSSQLAMYAARFLTRLTGQIKVGTEERSTEFRHLFFERVAFGPETCGAEVARQARFVCGPVRRLVGEGGVMGVGVPDTRGTSSGAKNPSDTPV
jgi:hypothetical protein